MDSPSDEAVHRGAKPKVSDSDIEELMDDGLSLHQMSIEFGRRGITISKQAIGLRAKQIKERHNTHNRVLPWLIKANHADGRVMYHAVLSYGKWRLGQTLSPKQLKAARELEDRLNKLGAVLLYRPDRGFVLRNRRDDDGPSVLAVA